MEMVHSDATDHSTSSMTSGHVEDGLGRTISEDYAHEDTGIQNSEGSKMPPSLSIPGPAAATEPTPLAAPVLIPSMRGSMTYAGGSISCKGKWAMSDGHHSIPGQSSDFEFKLVRKDEQCTAIFPVDGMYHGWFLLKQPLPLKGSIKVEDKEMELRFQPEEDSNNFQIRGHGSNKFGKFTLYGTLSEQGAIHIFREYYQLNPVPTAATPSSQKRPVGRPEGSSKKSATPGHSAADAQPETPRESSGRIRKQSSLLKESLEMNQPRPVPTPKPVQTPRAHELPPVPSSSGGERAHRLAPSIRKCSDLLREMSKLPQSRWFLEPVDPVKLQIPDYLKVIRVPMDFSTIRQKLETGAYDTVDAFAEDMRLVFSNAITFNAARENIVNINAREVSAKFEDRFRAVVSQLEFSTPNYALFAPEPKLSRSVSSSSFASSSKGYNSNKKRTSMGSTPRASVPGVRGAFPYVPPAAVDGNVTKLIELQRQMEDMKAELDRMRTQMHEKEITQSLRETTKESSAPMVPLTLEEKRQLVQMVGRLPSERMEDLIQIIRDGLPDDKKNDDITEVPLDILDTITLRRLQRFVRENISAKKRSAPSSSSNIPRAKSEPSLKKARRAGDVPSVDGVYDAEPSDDIGLFDHNDLLTEKFEDTHEDFGSSSGHLPKHESAAGGSDDVPGVQEEDAVEMTGDREDDQNDWAALGSG